MSRTKQLIILVILIGLLIAGIDYFYDYFHATPIPEDFQEEREGRAWE
jgi:hypothetical protein